MTDGQRKPGYNGQSSEGYQYPYQSQSNPPETESLHSYSTQYSGVADHSSTPGAAPFYQGHPPPRHSGPQQYGQGYGQGPPPQHAYQPSYGDPHGPPKHGYQPYGHTPPTSHGYTSRHPGPRGPPPNRGGYGHAPPPPHSFRQPSQDHYHTSLGAGTQDYQQTQGGYGQHQEAYSQPPPSHGYQRDNRPPYNQGPGGKTESFYQSDHSSIDQGYQSQGASYPTSDGDHANKLQSEETSADQEWVNSWLMKNKINHRLKEKKTQSIILSIPEGRRLMREALSVTEDLQQADRDLRENIHGSTETWQELVQKVKTLKVRLAEIKYQMSDSVVKDLTLKIEQTKKKRQRMKTKRKRDYKEELKKLKRREEIHQSIDEWRSRILKKEEDKKKEKELKAAADLTLGEVRRKLQEAERARDLLAALTKLRQLRKAAAMQKGLTFSSALDTDFDERVEEQNSVLQERLKVYQAEKGTLEAMLEMEAEETREREIEAKKLKIEELERRKERTTRRILFGREVQLDDDDPMAPFRQYYNQSKLSLENLVQIRQEWDLFLVPPFSGGSRLPEGWVTPSKPLSDTWASVLKDRQLTT